MRSRWIMGMAMAMVYGLSRGFGIPFVIKLVFPKVFRLDAMDLGLGSLLFYCSLPAFVAAIQGVSYVLSIYSMQVCAVAVMSELRRLFFEKLQHLPLTYFNKNPSGTLIARGLQDTAVVQAVFQQVTLDALRHPTTLLGAFAYLGYLCVQKADVFFLLLFLGVLPVCVFSIRFIGRRLRLKAQAVQEELMHISERLSQNLSAVREIRAFQLERYELEKFAKSTSLLGKAQLKVISYTISIGPIVEALAALGIGAALAYTYFHSIAFDEFSSLCLALYLCYAPLKELGQLHAKIQEGRVSLERIAKLIHEPTIESNPKDALPLAVCQGALRFEGVDFSYASNLPVLKCFSAVLQAGKSYALVGPSGAGKSTFAQLIPRFYEVDGGSIFLDELPITRLNLEDLRRQIAFVPQDPVLFNDTIYNNIRMGNLKASQEQIEAAARDAYAHGFIMEQEHGYATQVGDRGSCLSGGQRQRIALARAFVRNAPILILDEATSSLDAHSDQLIQKAIQKLRGHKTVLIISHRLNTVHCVDEILVFEGGRLLAQGPHAELLSTCPLYASLYKTHGDGS